MMIDGMSLALKVLYFGPNNVSTIRLSTRGQETDVHDDPHKFEFRRGLDAGLDLVAERCKAFGKNSVSHTGTYRGNFQVRWDRERSALWYISIE